MLAFQVAWSWSRTNLHIWWKLCSGHFQRRFLESRSCCLSLWSRCLSHFWDWWNSTSNRTYQIFNLIILPWTWVVEGPLIKETKACVGCHRIWPHSKFYSRVIPLNIRRPTWSSRITFPMQRSLHLDNARIRTQNMDDIHMPLSLA